MVTTRFISLTVLATLALACQKSALRAQREAVEAQDKANQVAADQSQKVADIAASAGKEAADKIAAARSDADKKIESANRQASARVDSAVDDAKSKIVDAQLAADRQAKQASEAFQRAKLDLETDIGKQLDTIDKRAAAVRTKLDGDKTKNPAQEARVKSVQAKSKTLRADLHAFETKTARSIDTFQTKLEHTLDDLRGAVDKLEGKPDAKARAM